MKIYSDHREPLGKDVTGLKIGGVDIDSIVQSALKFPRLILSFLRIRKIWTIPKKCDVLIFNSMDNNPIELGLSEILSSYGNIGRFILPNSGELNVPILLASILKRGSRISAYFDSYIQRVDPKLVINYLDNDSGFYSVAPRNPSVKTMFIQNGLRDNKAFKNLQMQSSKEVLKVNFMLVFGSHVGDEYAKYISGLIVPIGSIRNNISPRVNQKLKGTLSFISQYRDTESMKIDGVVYTRRFAPMILPFLARYAKDKGLKLRIILTGHNRGPSTLRNEKRYYKEILGTECEFFKWKWHGSGYDAVDSSEVVVSNDSSLGIEAIARGTKAAIFSFRSTLYGLKPPSNNYGWPGNYPDEGPFWTNNPSTLSFRRILDHLFTISDEQWRNEVERHGFKEVMQFDPNNSKLRTILAGELGHKHASK